MTVSKKSSKKKATKKKVTKKKTSKKKVGKKNVKKKVTKKASKKKVTKKSTKTKISKKVNKNNKFNIGDKVVKVISVMGLTTGSFHWIVSENKNKGYFSIADTECGEPWGHYDIHAYHKDTGKAFENNIPNCVSYLLTLEDALKNNIHMEED